MNETNQLLAQISQAMTNSTLVSRWAYQYFETGSKGLYCHFFCPYRRETAVLQPILNLIPPLLKARPALATNLVPSLTAWTPSAMQGANRSASQIRSVEKALKVTMVHLLRLVYTHR